MTTTATTAEAVTTDAISNDDLMLQATVCDAIATAAKAQADQAKAELHKRAGRKGETFESETGKVNVPEAKVEVGDENALREYIVTGLGAELSTRTIVVPGTSTDDILAVLREHAPNLIGEEEYIDDELRALALASVRIDDLRVVTTAGRDEVTWAVIKQGNATMPTSTAKKQLAATASKWVSEKLLPNLAAVIGRS